MADDFYAANSEWSAALVASWQEESNSAVAELLGQVALASHSAPQWAYTPGGVGGLVPSVNNKVAFTGGIPE